MPAAQLPTVHVVDGHGDALQHWETLPGTGYGVFHVDSHADMFLDFAAAGEHPEPASSLLELHKRLGPQVHLSNFIPLAILGGKVQNVLWMRSDFRGCRYNGPPPGAYQLSVGEPDAGLGGPALCYWQFGGQSFRDYSFMPSSLRGGYEVVGERDGWPPPEKNLWWEKVPYLLDSFGLHLLGEPMGTAFAPPRLAQPFGLAVVTDGQLAADPDAGAAFIEGQLGGRPWILDVDLDFFATLAPALAPAVRRLSLGREEANRLGDWSQELAVAVEAIEEESPGCMAFRLPLLTMTTTELLALGAEATPEAVAAVLREVDPEGAGAFEEELLARIAGTLRELTEADRATWRSLEPEEWDALVASPHGPHFVATPEGVEEAAIGLETVLRSLVKRQLPPPRIVTVARSTDLYLPLELGPLIEERFLAILARLGWAPAPTAGAALAGQPPLLWPAPGAGTAAQH